MARTRKRKAKVGVIYGIRNQQGTIVYIGKTTYPIEKRLRSHLSCARRRKNGKYKSKTPMSIWLRKCMREDFTPSIEVMEPDIPVRKILIKEKSWIKRSCDYNLPLLNCVHVDRRVSKDRCVVRKREETSGRDVFDNSLASVIATLRIAGEGFEPPTRI